MMRAAKTISREYTTLVAEARQAAAQLHQQARDLKMHARQTSPSSPSEPGMTGGAVPNVGLLVGICCVAVLLTSAM